MLRWLDTLTRADAPLTGAKAARLGELAAAGLPVPAGFVLDVAAYRAAVAAHPPLAEAIAALEAAAAPTALDDEAAFAAVAPLFMRMPLPPSLEAAVRDAVARLGEGTPLAVRSSAPGEDGAQASFAGQQQTFLNVVGPDQVLAGIRACWAGTWAAGVAAYRRQLAAAAGEPPAMAVLVQALVGAEAAGVAFTADPVSGARDRLVIDASWGLGEAVVSGRTTPDRVTVAKADGAVVAYELGAKDVEVVPEGRGVAVVPVTPERQARPALGPAAIAALHALAADVEAKLGPCQDLEFAWTGDRAVLLQARPITALPPAPPPGGWQPPEPGTRWERRNFAEHFPQPLSPLAETLVLPAAGEALVRLAASIGVALARPALVTVHGWAFARSDQRFRASVAWRAPYVYTRLFLADPARWEWAEPHARRVDRLLAARPADPAALAGWCEAMAGAFAATWADVHRLSAGWRWSEHVLRRVTGRPDLVAALLAGEPGEADAIAGEAAAIARSLSPDEREALATPDALPPAAVARIHALAARGAALPACFDPWAPLPLADPAAIAALVRQAAASGPPPADRHARLAAARAAALVTLEAEATPMRRRLLRVLVPWARRFANAREPALATIGHGWAGFRAGLLALGEALVAKGALAAAEDVFWLPWPEVRALAGGAPDPGAPARAAAARALHAERSGYAPPLGIGMPTHRLPPRAIVGIPASGGSATGRVRLVRGPEDFADFRAGEVLVASTTTPAWTPLFGLAAAIVTDVGGPLSHGSIVAREFGIPAVLGAEAATRRLRTGEIVTVDGDLGVVWPGGA